MVRSKNFLEKEDVDVFGKLIAKLSPNKTGLLEFEKACSNQVYSCIYDFNTVEKIPDNIIKQNTIDIVLTSPPYGDSRTTVAYGQFSRLANEWLGHKEANQIDNILMGGKKANQKYRFSSDIVNDVVSTIGKIDSERVRDVIAFYRDYEKSI